MLACLALAGSAGCHLIIPDIGHIPVIRNPFPQLSRVAVAPFFNQSDEPTVDGRKFALAYFAELQAVQGFEVVPLGVVEEAILEHQVDLSRAGEARRLARILGVDAVVIGSVTDYTPYYPPRCGLRVEWYAANPGLHEVLPGYGLPWGTPEEEFIPEPLVYEAEMALAKAQVAAQTPACDWPTPPPETEPPAPPQLFSPLMPLPPQNDESAEEKEKLDTGDSGRRTVPPAASQPDSDESDATSAVYQVQVIEEELPLNDSGRNSSLPLAQPELPALPDTTVAIGASGAACPSGTTFLAAPLGTAGDPCVPNDGPVMTHTRIYQGHDSDFAEALANYYYFRNDARFGGWQNYLQRSDDFIRFCCHIHIAEMLSARGGGDQTRVVWRWPDCR